MVAFFGGAILMKKLTYVLLILLNLSCARASYVTTVDKVDLSLYVGKWFEVAAIPQIFQSKCIANTTAEYSFAEQNLIQVINSCDTQNGYREVAEGRAMVVDNGSNSKLKVTFVNLFNSWIFPLGGNYWIVDLAPDYSYALIGDPKAKYAWILSRKPVLDINIYKNSEIKYKSLGYDTCEILTSVQTKGLQKRVPLCNISEIEKLISEI